MELQVDSLVAPSARQRAKRSLGVTLVAALYLLLATLVTSLALIGWGMFASSPMEFCDPCFIARLCGATLLAFGLALSAFGLFGRRSWARRIALVSLIAAFAMGVMLHPYL